MGSVAAQASEPVSRAGATAPRIALANADPVVGFAAAELAKYLAMAGGGAVSIELGLFSDFSIARPAGIGDPDLDDAIRVRVAGGQGFIAGINPRSVLLGVYRFLNELGFHWIRPGAEGEIVPAALPGRIDADLTEAAASRHRNICIEGSVSLSNVLDVVAWLPKAGYNSFFMQFREGYTFFDRWYSQEDNPKRRRAERFDREVAREYTVLIEREIARRGLLYHAVGHGWHLEAFGVPGIGWDSVGPLPEEFLSRVALVGGKRWIPWDIPMLAAMCYSDPEVQRRMVANIADFAGAHPAVHYLHVWLDDSFNNKCECERCMARRPADWYFQMLNALDRELARRGNPVKIVFLAYHDLLFPPLVERLQREDRFVFMYANGRGDYRQALEASAEAAVPEYRHNRNDLEVLRKPGVNVAILRGWKDFFRGDSFIYEYYFTRLDSPSRAATVARDIPLFRGYGLGGVSSCQTLRVFAPSALSMNLMGHALWHGETDFESYAAGHFRRAFGADGAACREFLTRVEDAVDAIRDLERGGAGKGAAEYEKLAALLAAFRPVIERNIAVGDAVKALSWKLVRFHAGLHDLWAKHGIHRAAGEGTLQQQAWHESVLFARAAEEDLQPWLEPMRFQQALFGESG
jgi:hypothetical protein